MKLTPLNENDYENIYAFMKPIWIETYQNIIPLEQINFLLNKYFKLENIKKYVLQGYQYYKIIDDNLISGYLVFISKENEVYIDKLYLNENSRGKYYPNKIFSYLIEKYQKDLTLNVNQKNTRAVNCYLKNGFIIEEEQNIVLKDNMINIDYKMRKKAK